MESSLRSVTSLPSHTRAVADKLMFTMSGLAGSDDHPASGHAVGSARKSMPRRMEMKFPLPRWLSTLANRMCSTMGAMPA